MKKFLLFSVLVFVSSCAGSWNYEGRTAAKNWGDLKEEFKFCKIGYNQSPINVTSQFVENELKFSYNNSDVEKQRVDHVMQIIYDSKNLVLRGKKKYFLRKIEFHHPSEHLVNGEASAMEMQIYHKSEDEQWLALAVFMEIGKENAEVKKIIKLLQNKEKEGKLDLSKIVKEKDKIFFYDGSFTTPPCKEGVKWYVMKTPITVSKEQMNQIIKLGIFAKSNARPAQEFHPEKY